MPKQITEISMLLGGNPLPAIWARSIGSHACRDGYVSINAIESIWQIGDGNREPFRTMIKTVSGETWMVLKQS